VALAPQLPDPAVPVLETAGALQEMVDAGKIRHVGVSNFDASQMAEFAETRPVEALQPHYQLFRRDIEAEVLLCCDQHDIWCTVRSRAGC
jgi:aryl-alcohol dehydrogenase-like predicted oxidoreductase